MESPARWASFAVLWPSGVPRVWVAPFWDYLCAILIQRQEVASGRPYATAPPDSRPSPSACGCEVREADSPECHGRSECPLEMRVCCWRTS